MPAKIIVNLTFCLFQLANFGLDQYGRANTFNGFGVVDSNINRGQQIFLNWGAEHCGKNPKAFPAPQYYLLEVAGGFGFVANAAIPKGIFYLLNDLDQRHIDEANLIKPPDIFLSQSEYVAGSFPRAPSVRRWRDSNYLIAGLGSFSYLHFLNRQEAYEFFDSAWDHVVPGGLLVVTAGTRFNRMLNLKKKRGQPKYRQAIQDYRAKLKAFRKDPHAGPLPGEILDVDLYNPDMSKTYPHFFNHLDPEVLRFLAERNPEKPWIVHEASYLQRPNPPHQAMTHVYKDGFGELVLLVAQKPGHFVGTPATTDPSIVRPPGID